MDVQLKVDEGSIGTRLSSILQRQRLTQAEFASQIDVSSATISSWINNQSQPKADQIVKICNLLRCSADWLLGLGGEVEEYSENERGLIWRWRVQIPDDLRDDSKELLQLGINVFKAYIGKERDLSQFRDKSDRTLNAAFRLALHSGALRLLYVPRIPNIEQKLLECYEKLKEVIVIPSGLDLLRTYMDTSVITTEAIAAFTALAVLGRYGGERVALGGGYSILRIAENSVPRDIKQFGGTTWIPVMSKRYYENDDLMRSPNYIAGLLANRHYGSVALNLPFVAPEYRHDTMDVQQSDGSKANESRAQRVLDEFRQVTTAFISIGGVDKNDLRPERFLRSSDGEHISLLRQRLYKMMVTKGTSEQFAGEVLSMMLDKNGEKLCEREIDKEVYALDLEILRDVAERNKVWLVTAGYHKRDAVHMAINCGLVSALVIEKSIAEHLVSIGTRQKEET